jgi:hypothetical protein
MARRNMTYIYSQCSMAGISRNEVDSYMANNRTQLENLSDDLVVQMITSYSFR